MGAGILSICIGLIILIVSFKPYKKGTYTIGEVCNREYKYSTTDTHNTYYITIRYFVNNNEVYTKSKFRTSYIKDGKKVLIKYDKQNNEDCVIITGSMILFSLIWIGFGIYAILSTISQ